MIGLYRANQFKEPPLTPTSPITDERSILPADLTEFPGHQVRRLQQIAVAIFLQETEPFGITPVQSAAMLTVADSAGMDQRTIARSIGFDTSTIAGVIDRLESRGLLRRRMSKLDARVRLVTLTDMGRELLEEAMPSVTRAQDRISPSARSSCACCPNW
jgi:DNA-binding MarR family transcriptional regulator